MRFQSLELKDIFAYRGPSKVNLEDCTAERNIVTVQGRNGHGKISLLNAVKLLSLGVEDERIEVEHRVVGRLAEDAGRRKRFAGLATRPVERNLGREAQRHLDRHECDFARLRSDFRPQEYSSFGATCAALISWMNSSSAMCASR